MLASRIDRTPFTDDWIAYVVDCVMWLSGRVPDLVSSADVDRFLYPFLFGSVVYIDGALEDLRFSCVTWLFYCMARRDCEGDEGILSRVMLLYMDCVSPAIGATLGFIRLRDLLRP